MRGKKRFILLGLLFVSLLLMLTRNSGADHACAGYYVMAPVVGEKSDTKCWPTTWPLNGQQISDQVCATVHVGTNEVRACPSVSTHIK